MASFKDCFTSTPTNLTGNRGFAKALVRMWIAGTMGAYLTFLFRNLALDVPTFSISQGDWSTTFDVWVRYAYLFWFLAYFFASNVRHERNDGVLSKWDIWFNVAQAAFSFGAAFFLGFIVRDRENGFLYSVGVAVGAADAAIALICIFSLMFFGYRAPEGEKTVEATERKQLNCLRWWGFGGSLSALGAVVLGSHLSEAWGIFVVYGVGAICGAVPFEALRRFMMIEWNRPPTPASGAAGAR